MNKLIFLVDVFFKYVKFVGIKWKLCILEVFDLGLLDLLGNRLLEFVVVTILLCLLFVSFPVSAADNSVNLFVLTSGSYN